MRVTFIHTHIPKTGGTSFNSTFAEQFLKEKRFSYHGENKIIFHNIPYYERRRIEAIFGHVDLTFHHNLPNRPIYLFIMRDPIERIYSIYKYIKKREDHPFHNVVKDLSFNKFIKSAYDGLEFYNNIFNVQARVIAGLMGVKGLSNEEIKSLSMSNILNYEIRYGFIDMYTNFLQKLNNEFGWNLKEYKKNVTQKNKIGRSKIMDMLDGNGLRILKQCSIVDDYIYNYLREKSV